MSDYNHPKDPTAGHSIPFILRKRSRAEMQEKFDRDYADGKITLDQWRFATDMLSDGDWT
jgi:hypothetical protein